MKKLFISVLIIASLLTTAASAAPMTDLQKSELKSFGIMIGDGNGNLRLNDNITRAEAARIICAAGNLSLKDGDITPFPDVPTAYWGYESIMIAKSHGIVVGDENGNFNPNAPVTNEEFVKMAVCLLNYGDLADQRGGFPAGYTWAGQQTGITDGLQFDINVPATRNDVGVMIHNALDVFLLEAAVDEEAPEVVTYKKTERTLRDNFR